MTTGSVIVYNPVGTEKDTFRMLRGGCWFNNAQDCRSAFRLFGNPAFRNSNFGFRLVYVSHHDVSYHDRDNDMKEFMKITVRSVVQGLRWIPPGEFLMGSPDNVQSRVRLTQGFWMFDTPVTQELWKAVMGINPSRFVGDRLPVSRVSWFDCQDFIKRIKEITSLDFRLPTEAEWEYACRAGTTTPFNTGDNLTTKQANYNGNYPYINHPKGTYIGKTTPVGSYPPNGWGLYDMHGNVWEWCQDSYNRDIHVSRKNQGIVENPVVKEGTFTPHVVRGGCWFNDAQYCRSAYRYSDYPGYRSNGTGFRLVFVPSDNAIVSHPSENPGSKKSLTEIKSVAVVCSEGVSYYEIGSTYNGLVLDRIKDKSIRSENCFQPVYVGFTADGQRVFEAINVPTIIRFKK